MSSGESAEYEAMSASIEPRVLRQRAQQFAARLAARLAEWWDFWTAEGGVAKVEQLEAIPLHPHGDGTGMDLRQFMKTLSRTRNSGGSQEHMNYLDEDEGGDVKEPSGAVVIELAAPGSDVVGSVVVPRLITGIDDLLPVDSGSASAIGAERPPVIQDTL